MVFISGIIFLGNQRGCSSAEGGVSCDVMAGGGAAAAMLCILLMLAFFDRSESRGPCDPLVPEYCILPFPSSFYTIPAETTTGLQVNFSIDTFPTDVLGRRTDPAEWNTFGELCS